MTRFITQAAAIAASFAICASAAQAQNAAQYAPAHAGQSVAIEQIYLLLDANQNHFEKRLLAKAEAGVADRAAKIRNTFAPAGAARGFILAAAFQTYTDCAS